MRQPIKNKVQEAINAKKPKRIFKKIQPIKGDIEFWTCKKPYKISSKRIEEKLPKTSNLEVLFEDKFLKKLKLPYIAQYKYNGFYYDFVILDKTNTNRILAFIEINGTFYHSDPRFYDRNNLIYENQKRQVYRDSIKKSLVECEGMVFIEIWEHDIKNNAKAVLNMLIARFGDNSKKR